MMLDWSGCAIGIRSGRPRRSCCISFGEDRWSGSRRTDQHHATGNTLGAGDRAASLADCILLLTDLTMQVRKEITRRRKWLIHWPLARLWQPVAAAAGSQFARIVARETACGCSWMSGGLPGPAWSWFA
jgi:hypothetical protein